MSLIISVGLFYFPFIFCLFIFSHYPIDSIFYISCKIVLLKFGCGVIYPYICKVIGRQTNPV